MIIESTGFVDVKEIKNDVDRLYMSDSDYLYLYVFYSKAYKCDVFLPVHYDLNIITDYEYDFDRKVYTPIYLRRYDCIVSKYFVDMDINKLKKVEVWEQDGKVKNDFIMR